MTSKRTCSGWARENLAWKIRSVSTFLAALLLLGPPEAGAEDCWLFPIGIGAESLAGQTPGAIVQGVLSDAAPGSFGWLSWGGSPNTPTLIDSLTPPGDSYTYVNPDAPSDRKVSIGDWIQGRPGLSNSRQVRDALDSLKNVAIKVPVWDSARGQGERAAYRVWAFARIQLLDYHLPNENRITFRFLGYVTCSEENLPPVVDAGPDQSLRIDEVAQLNGSVSDDGLPLDGTLTVWWEQISGPADVVFGDPLDPVTTATLSEPGTYVLRLNAGDGELSAFDDVVIMVNLPNRRPVAYSLAVVIDEDEPINLTLCGWDPDGDELTFHIAAEPSYGSLGFEHQTSDSATFTYAPIPDYNGEDSFTFRVSDGVLESELATVSITILPVNDPPEADSQTVTTAMDVPVEIVLSGSDIEGDPLTVILVTFPAHGTLNVEPGTLTSAAVIYTPDAGFLGEDSFTFKVNDGELDSEIAAVTIIVRVPPLAFNQQLVTLEDAPTQVVFSGFDPEDGVLAFVIVNHPGHGVLNFKSQTAESATFIYLPDLDYFGADSFTFKVNNGHLDSSVATVTITILPVNDRPSFELSASEILVQKNAGLQIIPGFATNISPGPPNEDEQEVWFELTPSNAAAFAGLPAISASGVLTFTTAEDWSGTVTVAVVARDDGGTENGGIDAGAAQVFQIVVLHEYYPPKVYLAQEQTVILPDSASLTGMVVDAGISGFLSISWSIVSGAGSVVFSEPASPVTAAAFSAPGDYKLRLTANDSLTTVSRDVLVRVRAIPPDPSALAPPVSRLETTSLHDAIQFLYTGSDPIQTDVDPATIEPLRVAVIRGRVLDFDGTPLSGVGVSVLNHPESGRTITRTDGRFDLAVNGGGRLTLSFAKTGYLTAERAVKVPWLDYVTVPDIMMMIFDPVVTSIDLMSPNAIQVAAGSTVEDDAGERQAVLLFPAGNTATVEFPNGLTLPLTTISVRITEYTVGPNGPAAMPATLPPQIAYTYCAEVSIDEAVALGASGVSFSAPVYYYLENFLDFPVGQIVPAGYYRRGAGGALSSDSEIGGWTSSDNGLVLAILSVSNGIADIDIDGSGTSAGGSELAALGFTDAELETLAALYPAGQSLWRVPITHLTPWDYNWPFIPPLDAVPPRQPPPETDVKQDDPCKERGSIIETDNQVLGQAAGITGTGLSLHYSSGRASGRLAAQTVRIPLSGSSVPESLERIELEVSVAGRMFTETFPAKPEQAALFTWDGKDAYGRDVGEQQAGIAVGYVYRAFYAEPARIERSFGAFLEAAGTMNEAREEITFWQRSRVALGLQENRIQGLGGWSVNVHHIYSPVSRVLYEGAGNRRSAENVSSGLNTYAGGWMGGGYGDDGPALDSRVFYTTAMAVGPAGDLYFAHAWQPAVRRVNRDGIISRVAGTYVGGFSGDGAYASDARFDSIHGLALAPDGSLYLADSGNYRIRRVCPDGIVTTVVGTGQWGFSGDGGPAPEARIDFVWGLDFGPDGSLYIADNGNRRIRRVDASGIITTVAGNGQMGFSGDGGPAILAQIDRPQSVKVGRDGSIYFIQNNRIRRIGPDGIIATVAGSGLGGFSGDGGPAVQAQLFYPSDIALGPDDSLYIADDWNDRVRRVGTDGLINTVAGNGERWLLGRVRVFGVPPTQLALEGVEAVAIGPDGSLYFKEAYNFPIHRINTTFPGPSSDDIILPSEGGNGIYVFSEAGRHLRTLDALTGRTLFEFAYTEEGWLEAISDLDGDVTTIERDPAGKPLAIVAPFGQRTELELDANGFLSKITNPAGEFIALETCPDGLLQTFIDPRTKVYQYTYDDLGRLISAADPEGGGTALERIDFSGGREIVTVTAMGRSKRYRTERRVTGEQVRIFTDPSGSETVTRVQPDGVTTSLSPDGTLSSFGIAADARWGIQAPFVRWQTVKVPSGLTMTVTNSQSLTLTEPGNPRSAIRSKTNTTIINGKVFRSVYDGTARAVTNTTPVGRQTSALLDEKGRVIAAFVPGLASLEYLYDTHGRLTNATIAAGSESRTSSFGYGADGWLSFTVDPLGRTNRFLYDSAGRLTNHFLPDGRVAGYFHDANGNVIAVTPPGRPAHSYEFNAVNSNTNYVPPDVGIGPNSTRFTYNLDRQMEQVIRPGGETIDFDYDDAGRLSTLTVTDGQIIYGYNESGCGCSGEGQLSSLTALDGGMLGFDHDGSLLTNTVYNGTVTGSVGRVYDNHFRTASLRVNGANPISFGYDNDGLLTQAGLLSLVYNATNGLPARTVFGGMTNTWDHNSFAETTNTVARFRGTNYFTVEYLRDSAGRITRLTEVLRTNNTTSLTNTLEYSYDAAGRLTTVVKDGQTAAQYIYGDNNQRLSHVTPAMNIANVYDDQDRLQVSSDLTAGTAVHFGYTPNGERESKTSAAAVTAYEYDGFGNLAKVLLPNGNEIEYVLDGSGRRIGRKANGVLVQGFLYQDTLRPIAELGGNNQVVSRFVYGTRVNVPEYMIKGGVSYRIVTDHLGSPRLVVNLSNGAIVQRMDYDEYGNVIYDSNPGFQPFGFAGGLYDRDTKLVRFGARDYDPEVGQWTTKDPIGLAGGLNVYEYASNDPINWIDPLGLSSIIQTIKFADRTRASIQTPLDYAEQGYALANQWEQVRYHEATMKGRDVSTPEGAYAHWQQFPSTALTVAQFGASVEGQIYSAFGPALVTVPLERFGQSESRASIVRKALELGKAGCGRVKNWIRPPPDRAPALAYRGPNGELYIGITPPSGYIRLP